MTTFTKISKTEHAEALKDLRAIIQPGDTVYCILRHVSTSGMSRKISLVIVTTEERNGTPKPVIRDVSRLAAKVMRDPFDDEKYAIKVNGCGMDMGFHLVYNLASVLFTENMARDDRDSGYMLKSEWL